MNGNLDMLRATPIEAQVRAKLLNIEYWSRARLATLTFLRSLCSVCYYF